MIVPIRPLLELLSAKATTTLDVGGFRLPQLHAFGHFAAMDQAQMLSQMIFPVERSGGKAFLFTSATIVIVEMFTTRVHLSTEDTFFATIT